MNEEKEIILHPIPWRIKPTALYWGIVKELKTESVFLSPILDITGMTVIFTERNEYQVIAKLQSKDLDSEYIKSIPQSEDCLEKFQNAITQDVRNYGVYVASLFNMILDIRTNTIDWKLQELHAELVKFAKEWIYFVAANLHANDVPLELLMVEVTQFVTEVIMSTSDPQLMNVISQVLIDSTLDFIADLRAEVAPSLTTEQEEESTQELTWLDDIEF